MGLSLGAGQKHPAGTLGGHESNKALAVNSSHAFLTSGSDLVYKAARPTSIQEKLDPEVFSNIQPGYSF